MSQVTTPSSLPGRLPHRQAPRQQQCLTLRIGPFALSVAVELVQEIRAMCPSTPLSDGPVGMVGLVNIRGVIVPVFDGRALLHVPPDTSCATPRALVVLSTLGRAVGVIADQVDAVAPMARDLESVGQRLAPTADRDYLHQLSAVLERMLLAPRPVQPAA